MVYTDAMGSVAVASVDGRRARSVKTREAIVDAFITLIEGGDLKPTAAAIAARAGLSVRSVFQHFLDLEDLLLAVSDRQTNRIASMYTGVQYDGDLSSRIDTFADYRARLFEMIAPIRRAAMLQEPFSQIVATRLELARTLHRLDVERAFAPELEAARVRGNAGLGDAVAVVTSFVVWDEMRRFAGLDVRRATDSLRYTVTALLTAGIV
jgi:TetR/AcrR family transcriptional regulator, regulator of autoinduction and epiphytic fitness